MEFVIVTKNNIEHYKKAEDAKKVVDHYNKNNIEYYSYYINKLDNYIISDLLNIKKELNK